MRLMIAAALLLFAPPATQLDTRRTNLTEITMEHSFPGYACNFAALPGLTLQHHKTGGWAMAGWSAAAEGRTADDAKLMIGYQRREGAPFGASPWASFWLGDPRGRFTRSDKTARLTLDGRVIEAGAQVQQDETGKRFSITWPSVTGYPSKDALPRGNVVTLDLLDAKGATIASYRWDFRHIDEIPELLSRVRWNCLTPDS